MENRILELRKQRRITQEELAKAVGVSRQTIISLEKGKYNASLRLAYKIAVFLDSSIEELFAFEERKNQKEREELKEQKEQKEQEEAN